MSRRKLTVTEKYALDEWMIKGDRGTSSEYLAMLTMGIEPESDVFGNWPHDPADLVRCQRLVDRCRAVRMIAFPKAARRSPVWKALVDHWDQLLQILSTEVPNWKQHQEGGAPRTYRRMRELIEQAEEVPQ